MSEFGLLAPLTLLAIGAMAVFVVGLALWTREVDSAARVREESLVHRGVAGRIAEIEKAVFPETNWDDAVAHLDNRFDPVWADKNLTAYYEQTVHFDDLFVLDGVNRPVYARSGGEPAPLGSFDAFASAQPLIAAVRKAEAERGPFAPVSRKGAGQVISAPIQASALLVVRGETHLVNVTLVQPDFGAALPRGPRAALVVTSARFGANDLSMLADRFQLADLKGGLGEANLRPGDAAARFATLNGPELVLSWTPQRPGTALLQKAIAPVALVLVVFCAMGVLMVSRARRAAAQLVATARAQSEFLANMSHEIRTPLNGVTAIADALERTPLDAAQAEMVGIISTSGATLQRLLSDILDLSRIETGAVEIECEPFHLGEAVRAAAALIRPHAVDKGLELRVQVDAAAETELMGDVVRVKQVLTNLLSNAVKFTAAGHVCVQVARDGEIGVDPAWRIVVEDTGVGFDAAEKARIFDRFHQADASVTRKFGGAGLGLAICRQLTALMGGELDAEGRLGEGAAFTLRLPLARALSSPQPRVAEAMPDRPLSILLADDHPANRRVLQVLLEPIGADLVCVENGQEACNAFKLQAFDIVLMDMQMPVMDGLTATRRLREHERAARRGRTPLIMLTANAMPEHQTASLAAGADLHMAKPIEPAKLYAALAELTAEAGPALAEVSAA